jgi:hypothetical protein
MNDIMENEKINPSDDLVAQYILKSLSKETLSAYRLMTVFKYPIADKQAFVIQLDSVLNDSEEANPIKDTAQSMREFFTPLDFPVLSLQSGLEKLHTKLSSRFSFLPDPILPDISDILEDPIREDVRTEYVRQFGPLCGQEAFQVYLQIRDRLRDKVPEPIAFYEGWKKGRRCLRGTALRGRPTL